MPADDHHLPDPVHSGLLGRAFLLADPDPFYRSRAVPARHLLKRLCRQPNRKELAGRGLRRELPRLSAIQARDRREGPGLADVDRPPSRKGTSPRRAVCLQLGLQRIDGDRLLHQRQILRLRRAGDERRANRRRPAAKRRPILFRVGIPTRRAGRTTRNEPLARAEGGLPPTFDLLGQ